MGHYASEMEDPEPARSTTKRAKLTTFQKQQRDAAKEVRKLKKAAPYLFAQYQRLRQAQDALVSAQREVDLAQKLWDRLGEWP